jgi:hypothetical protein
MTRSLFECVYCGKPVPDGCPHPNVFFCCGEVGHTVESEEVVASRELTEAKA